MPRLDAPVRQPRCIEALNEVFPPFGHVRVAGQPGLGSVEGAGQEDFGRRSRRYDVSVHFHFLLCDGRFGDIIAVSALFQFNRQFLAAAADDSTLRHHMHGVRHDVVENTLVMGNDEETAAWRSQRIDAIGDHPQGVDVEAGIGFIENCESRLQQRHLENIHALFLAAGKTDVERAL